MKRCGICLLYAQDSEKFDATLGELKEEEDFKAKRPRGESEARGSYTLRSYGEQDDELLPQRIQKKTKLEVQDQLCS